MTEGASVKAITYSEYGSPEVLRLEETDKPTINPDEILVRIQAAAVNPLDWHFMRGTPYFMRLMTGLARPKTQRLGVDFSGEVEAVGAEVMQFKPGDRVFGACRGAFGEYGVLKESSAVEHTGSLTPEQAATIPIAGLTALQGIRDKGGVQPGHEVLINGASGGVGTFAVQIARALGATVTGVCSARNIELVQSIGADHVIDYGQEDFTQRERRYDLVFHLAGNPSLSALRRVLKPGGKCVMAGGSSGRWKFGFWSMIGSQLWSAVSSRKLIPMLTKENKADLATVRDYVEAKQVNPVIDRRYALAEVPEAIRYLETGRARGKVVIVMGKTDTEG